MKMQVSISPNGRVAFPTDLINPARTQAVIGVDILYARESEELAFEVYRLPMESYRDRELKSKELDTTLVVKSDNSIDISAYFGRINFFHIPTHKQLANYQAELFDNYIIVKLNPNNPNSTLPMNFKPIVLERTRHTTEVTLSTCGLLTLPKEELSRLFKDDRAKVDIQFNPNTKTFTLELSNAGERTIKKDATLNLQAMLKAHGVQIPQRLFLPYSLEGNTLTFCLTDKDPLDDRKALRQVRRTLGLTM